MNSSNSLRGMLDLVWGRRFFVAGTALAVLLAAIVATFFLPREYVSSAKVRVAGEAGEASSAGKETPRFPVIRAGILSHDNLEDLIHALKLSSGSGQEKLVAKVRAHTSIERVKSSPEKVAFRISYRCGDPALAQQVVTRLSSGYRNRARHAEAEKRKKALEDVTTGVRSAEKSYAKVTEDLAAFEKAHPDYRFGKTLNVKDELARAQSDLQKTDRQISSLEKQLADVKENLAGEPEFRKVAVEQGDDPGIARIRKELEKAKVDLATLLTSVPEKDPKVQALKARIAKKEEDLAAAAKRAGKAVRKVPNKVYGQLLENKRQVEAALLVARQVREDYAKREKSLATQAKSWPELNRRWTTLSGRKGELKTRVGDLKKKQQVARKAYREKAARSAVGFVTLSGPSYPLGPTSPNRLLIAIAGLVLGMAGAAATVLAKEFFDRSFRITEEVAAAFDFPVLGSIARIETLAEREAGRKKRRVATATVVALLLAVGLMAFLQVRYDDVITSFLRGTGRAG